jgi:hypothetical protein
MRETSSLLSESILEAKGEHLTKDGYLKVIINVISKLKDLCIVNTPHYSGTGFDPDLVSNTIPLYIVTSNDCDDFIFNSLECNKFFNYAPILIFPLDDLALLTQDGQMVLETKTSIKKLSMGYGGVIRSLYKRSLTSKDM